MFIRFDCGCKGISIDGDMDSIDVIIVERCDRDEVDGLIFNFERWIKSWSPIEEEQLGYFDRIQSLIRDGYRYREIKRLLNS